MKAEEVTPRYLYKILSTQDWAKTQGKKAVQLSSMDTEFIHLSTQDQLEPILKKFWSHVSECILLKLEASKLPGRLVFEANPGGQNRYYHLYDGSIPLDAVTEHTTRRIP